MKLQDLRNLPDPVLERLRDTLDDGFRDAVTGLQVVQRGKLYEARKFAKPLETRGDPGENPGALGYATVWDWEYDVYGGPPYGWTEVVRRGTFTKSIQERSSVKHFFDHYGLPLASTNGNTLRCEEDDIGLLSDADFDPRSTYAMDVWYALDRKDLDEMSLAMRVTRQDWNDDYTYRQVVEAELRDTSTVSFGANPATVVQARSDNGPEETPTDVEVVPSRMSLSYAQAQLDIVRTHAG